MKAKELMHAVRDALNTLEGHLEWLNDADDLLEACVKILGPLHQILGPLHPATTELRGAITAIQGNRKTLADVLAEGRAIRYACGKRYFVEGDEEERPVQVHHIDKDGLAYLCGSLEGYDPKTLILL